MGFRDVPLFCCAVLSVVSIFAIFRWGRVSWLLDFKLCGILQWRSQIAEKVTHIKRSLLYQAIILYNYVPFQNVNFS